MLRDRIQSKLKEAMLSEEKLRVEVLRSLKSALLYAEVEGGGKGSFDDAQIEGVLQKELKKRFEAAEMFDRGGNAEAASKERDEAQIIQEFLPKLLTAEELKDIIDSTVSDLNISVIARTSMGQIMGHIKKAHGASVDSSLLAKLIQERIKE